MNGGMTGSCHCGRVSVSVPAKPDYLNVCNCTLCTRIGGLWAYYPRTQVETRGETLSYIRADESDPYLATHFCGVCSTTTHWAPLAADAPDRMGVNMRLFDPAELAGIEVRYGDRRNHDTGQHYYRDPTIFDGIGAPV